MTMVLAVALGGALGAPLRFLLERWVTNRMSGVTFVVAFAWGLFAVNVAGSALAGVVFAATSGALQTFLLTGFCGALTTFSGYAWELNRLWSGPRLDFWASFIVTPIAAVAAFWLTWQVTLAFVGG